MYELKLKRIITQKNKTSKELNNFHRTMSSFSSIIAGEEGAESWTRSSLSSILIIQDPGNEDFTKEDGAESWTRSSLSSILITQDPGNDDFTKEDGAESNFSSIVIIEDPENKEVTREKKAELQSWNKIDNWFSGIESTVVVPESTKQFWEDRSTPESSSTSGRRSSKPSANKQKAAKSAPDADSYKPQTRLHGSTSTVDKSSKPPANKRKAAKSAPDAESYTPQAHLQASTSSADRSSKPPANKQKASKSAPESSNFQYKPPAQIKVTVDESSKEKTTLSGLRPMIRFRPRARTEDEAQRYSKLVQWSKMPGPVLLSKRTQDFVDCTVSEILELLDHTPFTEWSGVEIEGLWFRTMELQKLSL